MLLVDKAIGDKRRLGMPSEALAVVAWAPAAGEIATFEKMELGRARILHGDARASALVAAGENDEARAAVVALMETAKWERDNRIVVPRSVAQHVLGIGVTEGPVYVRPTPESFEIWGERFYAQWITAQRGHLP